MKPVPFARKSQRLIYKGWSKGNFAAGGILSFVFIVSAIKPISCQTKWRPYFYWEMRNTGKEWGHLSPGRGPARLAMGYRCLSQHSSFRVHLNDARGAVFLKVAKTAVGHLVDCFLNWWVFSFSWLANQCVTCDCRCSWLVSHMSSTTIAAIGLIRSQVGSMDKEWIRYVTGYKAVYRKYCCAYWWIEAFKLCFAYSEWRRVNRFYC